MQRRRLPNATATGDSSSCCRRPTSAARTIVPLARHLEQGVGGQRSGQRGGSGCGVSAAAVVALAQQRIGGGDAASAVAAQQQRRLCDRGGSALTG